MKKLWVGFLGLMLAGNVGAANWVEVAESKNSLTVYYLDLDSISKSNKQIAGMYNEPVYSIYVQETYKKGATLRKKGLYYSKINYLIDCNQKSYYQNAVAAYDIKENIVDSWQPKSYLLSDSDFKAAFPETIARAIIDNACNTKLK